MNPRHTPFLWTGAAIAVGALLIVGLRGIGGDGALPPTQPAPPTAAPATGAATPAVAPLPPAEVLPWSRAQPSGPEAAARAAATLPVDPAMGAAAIDAAGAIATIRRQSHYNVTMVDELLRELDSLETSGQATPDMGIDALRGNLVVARRAQVLALELAESTQQPDTPERQRRTAAILGELQQLQGQLRYDVAPATPSTPGRTP